jgi:hypothetical protein
MSTGARRSKVLWVAALAIIAVIVAVVFWPEYRLRQAAAASVGLSEAAVVAKLGAPFSVVTAEHAQASPQWWGAGWAPAPNRPVVNKVLLYYGSFTGALVYIGASGKVDHVHMVGT